MALLPLNYTKNWTDSLNFPTVENSEEQVRADMQYLYDEIKEYINSNLVDDGSHEGPMSASQIPFKSSKEAMSAISTIKAGIDYLYDQVQGVVAGAVADRSVTSAKLALSAVEEENIKDGEVNLATKVNGVLSTTNGGVGADISTPEGKESARQSLGIGAAGTHNIVPLVAGGTGVNASTLAGKETARSNLGLGDCSTENVLPISKGGTNATTVAGARNNLGLGNTGGALPVGNGGTGSDTAAGARENLSAQKQHSAITTESTSVTTSGVSVACTGVTADNTIVVSAYPEDFENWQNGNVRCTAQGNGTITLKSDATVSVRANVLIFD